MYKSHQNVSFVSSYLEENLIHEGTWIIWPKGETRAIEHIWVALVQALSPNEKVHIVFYSRKEQERICTLLMNTNIDFNQIDCVIHRYNSQWARDIGPIFVRHDNKLKIINNYFNGWDKYPYKGDRSLIDKIAKRKHVDIITPNEELVLEGGAIDKYGSVILTTRSNLLKRNPHLSEEQIEVCLKKYYGAREVVWLNGVVEAGEITDCHIDGYARLLDENTVITCTELLSEEDKQILANAQKKIVSLPYLGELSYIYLNYYIANKVIVVPKLDKQGENKVFALFQKIFSDYQIIPINVDGLYQLGGVLHCITHQQISIERLAMT